MLLHSLLSVPATRLAWSICLPREIHEVKAKPFHWGVICGLKTLILSGLRAKPALGLWRVFDKPGGANRLTGQIGWAGQ